MEEAMDTDEVIDQLTRQMADPSITPAKFDELVRRVEVLRQQPTD
jgi:hypothetical protein